MIDPERKGNGRRGIWLGSSPSKRLGIRYSLKKEFYPWNLNVRLKDHWVTKTGIVIVETQSSEESRKIVEDVQGR